MAERLSKVYGTQMDKVNCPFFYKIGACRYGDSCQRIHNKPPISQTVLLEHMYQNNAIQTALISGNIVNKQEAEKALEKFENFYEDVFKQMSAYGEIQDMIVVDNLGDHLVGNVYIKYTDQDYAEIAQQKINGRFFAGKKINAVFSPVTDFMNAKCKQHIDGSCKRGGYCNYMHVKPLSKSFKRELFQQMYIEHPQFREKKRDQSEQDDIRRYRRQNNKRREREKKDRRSRSKSKDKRRNEKKRSRRSPSSESRDSSLDRKFMIDQWNKDYYKN